MNTPKSKSPPRPRASEGARLPAHKNLVEHSGGRDSDDKIARRDALMESTDFGKRPKITLDVPPMVMAAAMTCAKDLDESGVAALVRKRMIQYLRAEGYLTRGEP